MAAARDNELANDAAALLNVEDLRVQFATREGLVRAVDGISFSIKPGRSLGLVGESGSGKSVAALSIMGLLSGPNTRVEASRMNYNGVDLLRASQSELRGLRGRHIGMVFQEPMASLNPVLTVGDQVTEVRRAHGLSPRRRRFSDAAGLLRGVDINEPERRARQYPHNFSGGMRQRVMIATALSCDPELLILDEPTTALDVTVQAQILELVSKRVKEAGSALLLITHDFGVVEEMADDVAVMYAGRIVEYGPVSRVLRHPRHPYTEALINSMPTSGTRGGHIPAIPGSIPPLSNLPAGCSFHPRCKYRTQICVSEDPKIGRDELSVACWHPRSPVTATARNLGEPSPARRAERGTDVLLRVSDVSKDFTVRSARKSGTEVLRAVDRVSFDLHCGEVLGVVGESGSGKTTLGKMLVGLEAPTAGSIEIDGEDIRSISKRGAQSRALRRNVQFVFQDPYGSLNPRMTIGTILAESLRANADKENDWGNRRARTAVIEKTLTDVGLGPGAASRYPHEFSGGQRQRIAIARALIMRPKLVVCDEPVSALDVSVQGQVLNLLADLRSEYDLAMIFIAHDLAVIEHVSDRIAVMYLGAIVEIGDAGDVSTQTRHPYTSALLSAAPEVSESNRRERIVLRGEIPSPMNPPSGCRFHTRCWLRTGLGDPAICVESSPDLTPRAPTHLVACHFERDVLQHAVESRRQQEGSVEIPSAGPLT